MKDFNWVEARSQCNVFQVFRELQSSIEEEVGIRHQQTEGKNVGFRFQQYGEKKFAVYRNSLEKSMMVEFRCDAAGIYAKGDNSLDLKATLSLNDEGECRLKVGTEELMQWQFRRRALEDLFFGF